ncbi:MAG: hypothetical protein ACJ8G7_02735, partial [Rhizobacter sp.]
MNGMPNLAIRQSAPTAVPVGVGGATAVGSATVQCLAGERAVGGGDDVGGTGENGTLVVDSQPTDVGGIPNGWTVKVLNASNVGGGP